MSFSTRSFGALVLIEWAVGCSGEIDRGPAPVDTMDAEALRNCDDRNPCTSDSKSMGQCRHSAVANGTTCPNGTCQSGSCLRATLPIDMAPPVDMTPPIDMNPLVDVTPLIPNAPTHLTVSGITATQAILAWQDNSFNDTGFKIESATSPTGTFRQIATTWDSHYVATSLPPSTTTYFRVKAWNASGDSLPTDPQGATTLPPESCATPVAITPIPDMRLHVGFPIDFRATWIGCPGQASWNILSGPAELTMDNSGGLLYWTPTQPGTFTITIKLTSNRDSSLLATRSFVATVDDNTMTSPLFRDYRREVSTVAVQGRVHGAISSYSLYYTDEASPAVVHPIAGPLTSQVSATDVLANWDISSLPDGGRYLLILAVQLADGSNSVVFNHVILDRSAKSGWPKRIGPMTYSPVLADLDDDGKLEVIAFDHFSALWVWKIDGTLLWKVENDGLSSYNAPAVGDIDGDGRPEIVHVGGDRISAHRADGSRVPGFPVSLPPGSWRTVPTLADLDGDGRLDIIVAGPAASGGQVIVYRYLSGSLQPMPGWPQGVDSTTQFDSSPSVADLDGDGRLEVVTENYDKVLAWHADGTAVAGLHRAPLVGPINGAAGSYSTSQPALADLNGDGRLEIIIGSNVLEPDGSYLAGWAGGKAGAVNALSAAIGDLDGNPANGLEVVLGSDAWHADGTLARARLPIAGRSAVLGDCGMWQLDTILGTRFGALPGIDAYSPSGVREESYPKSLYGEMEDTAASVVGDFDDDGMLDVCTAITDSSYGGIIACYNMEHEPNHDEGHHWPMLGHDARHTGLWTPPPPNRPTHLARGSGTTGSPLSWSNSSRVASGFRVERSTSGAGFSYQTIATLPVTTSYVDLAAPVGMSFYRVRAERRDPRTGALIVSAPSNVLQISR